MEKIQHPAASVVLHSQPFFYKHSFVVNAVLRSSILRIPAGLLKAVEFRHYLAERIPLVITDLNCKLQLSWSPADLIKEHGSDICLLEDCEEKEHRVKRRLKTFLSCFMNSIGEPCDTMEEVLPHAIWRIKVGIS